MLAPFALALPCHLDSPDGPRGPCNRRHIVDILWRSSPVNPPIQQKTRSIYFGSENNSAHNIVPEQVPEVVVAFPRSQATMLESEKYREYVRDCIRLAEQMSSADKQTLLKIAEAWEMRALDAEREEKRKG